MKRGGLIAPLTALVCALLCAVSGADVTVSVQISGTVDELTQILEVLKGLGIGTAEATATEGGLPISLHSLIDRPAEAGAAPEPAAPPKPPLAFLAAQTTPDKVHPGNEVLVTLEVSDPDRRVDTIVATLSGATDADYDLFDNGKRGDAVAHDGIWTLALPVPPSAGIGSYVLSFKAYDEFGDQVFLGGDGENRRPLSLRTTFEVVR